MQDAVRPALVPIGRRLFNSSHMGDKTNPDTSGMLFKERLAAQVFGLFLWPLLTVALVAGALYFDRVRNHVELTTQKEILLVRATALLMAAGRQTVLSDLHSLVAQPVRFGAAAGRAGTIGNVFADPLAELLQRNPSYERIVLAEPQTGRSAQVRFRETIDGRASGNDAQTVDDIQRLVDELALHPETPMSFPAVLSIDRGASIDVDDPSICLGIAVPSTDGRGLVIAAIDYRLFEVVEIVSEIGYGDQGYVTVIHDVDPLWSGETAGVSAGKPFLSAAELRRAVADREHGHLFVDGSLYTFARFAEPPTQVPENDVVTSNRAAGRTVVISELPAGYFTAHRKTYVLFLSILALALLVPSFVVCLFLAKARLRAQQERHLRTSEQVKHMGELEHQVRQRTRELDDRNLQLSAEIAERLNAENRLRQTNELLTGMVESIDGIIYVADFDTHEILYANEYLKRLFGFDPTGRKCWQFIHASKDGPCSFCVNHRLLDEHHEPTGAYLWEYQNPFNKKWYAAKDQAIRWSNGKYVKLEIAIDITEQKQLQQFLREARKQAEIARNMRSRFVALVAHDLKSPFYSITQMLRRILEREKFSSEIHRQFLENIVTNGYRMLQMIDDLLSMDRFESAEVKLERTFFDVQVMTDEVFRNFCHLAADKALQLINRLPSRCMIFADKYLYFVVLNNLVSNAIKFSEADGVIEVFSPDPQRPMTIAVRDEGRGMDADYLANLFKVDVKTTSTGTSGESGSGLGLIFCQDILKAHGGELTVVSEPGVGTMFSIVLPECCACRGSG